MNLRYINKRTIKSNIIFVSAIGCPDPMTPPGGWMQRRGDHVTMGCNDTKISWKQSCTGQLWHGESGSCATDSTSSKILGVLDGGMVNLPYGLSVAVIVIVAITIGCLILIIGLVIVKR